MPHRSYQLLGILQSYAPRGSAQQLCAKLYNDACAEGVSESQLNLVLASALVDGLRHGNWPWTPKKVHDATIVTQIQAV